MSIIKQGIAEFVAERTAMEQRIRTMIAAELAAFHDLTGATVESIQVGLVTMQFVGTPAERFVSSVKVDTPLD